VVLRHSRYSLVLMVTLSIDFNSCHTLKYFQNIKVEQMFVINRRAVTNVSITREDLIKLIEKLTDEQTEYVFYLLDTLFCQSAN
jgi:hypothetical protein